MTREQVLGEMRQLLERAGVSPEPHLIAQAGNASTTIVDQALTTKADLIVIGTHGLRGVRRLLLGSVTETVLHEAPCPVLTVSPHTEAATSDVVTFKRILVIEWLPEDEPRTSRGKLVGSAHFNIPEFRGRFHDGRHTALTRLAEKGVPDWVIRAQFGHVSPTMMAVYSHVRRKALNEAAETLEPDAMPTHTPDGPEEHAEGVTSHVTSQSGPTRSRVLDFPRKYWLLGLDSHMLAASRMASRGLN